MHSYPLMVPLKYFSILFYKNHLSILWLHENLHLIWVVFSKKEVYVCSHQTSKFSFSCNFLAQTNLSVDIRFAGNVSKLPHCKTIIFNSWYITTQECVRTFPRCSNFLKSSFNEKKCPKSDSDCFWTIFGNIVHSVIGSSLHHLLLISKQIARLCNWNAFF